MREKQEALQNRSTELEALRSEAHTLTARLSDAASAKQRVEHVLQQELKRKTELLESKDAAIRELNANLSARLHVLENQIHEKDALLKTRDTEVDAVMAQLTKMGSAKKEIENSLRAELEKTTEVLEAKDSTIRELEASLNKTVAALENQVSEQETLLKGRDGEIEGLRSETQALIAQLNSMRSMTERPGGLRPEDLASGNGSKMKELEEDVRKVQALESLLKEKEDLLKIHDGKIERLEAELKEKRTELARHQITVWQSIERRSAWKHRLRKVGITLKD
jgi:chromosome segregation ATPase